MEGLVSAAGMLFEPLRLMALFAGVCLGLIVGVIPGLGGIFGLALLVPLTYAMDPYTAIAVLLGLSAVTTTSDTVPAVLLGVPGTVGSAATVVDGHPMAKNGEAARAFGAAYSASMIGGLLGAILLAATLPVLRPVLLSLNFGDFLAITIFAITLIALLSSKSPLKGIVAALAGALLSYVGIDPHEGVFRWTFGQVYLYDGIPATILFLGLFGLSELASLAGRSSIQTVDYIPKTNSTLQGIRDTLANWRVVLRGSLTGSFLGAVPGIGASIIDWIAYGDAARKPGPGVPFGEGNVRGVIAPESANNAKEGGSLVPTLAFGIPGSASMTILLSAFLVQGVVPGPDLLERHNDLLIAMILTIALANIIGTAICLGATRQLARIATVPSTILAPIALVFVVMGAFQFSRSPEDIILLLVFGWLGIVMKHANWSRPAFVLGFVLGPNLERFFFLSYQISGWQWLTQPLVLVILAISIAGLIRRAWGWQKARVRGAAGDARLPFDFPIIAICLVGSTAAAITAAGFPFAAGAFPAGIAAIASAASLWLMIRWLFRQRGRSGITPQQRTEFSFLAVGGGLGFLILFLGHLWAPVVFFALWAMWSQGWSRMRFVVNSAIVTALIYAVFDYTGTIRWPDPWLEQIVRGVLAR